MGVYKVRGVWGRATLRTSAHTRSGWIWIVDMSPKILASLAGALVLAATVSAQTTAPQWGQVSILSSRGPGSTYDTGFLPNSVVVKAGQALQLVRPAGSVLSRTSTTRNVSKAQPHQALCPLYPLCLVHPLFRGQGAPRLLLRVQRQP